MTDELFSKNGFTLIAPEKYSLSHMIYIIRNARTIVSMSGTICHNMIFGNDGQSVTILERTVLNNDYQHGINVVRNLTVTPVDCSLAFYPVEIGYGPFIIYYNEYLKKYIRDRAYIEVDSKFLSKKYTNRLIRNYFKRYKLCYANRWILEEWMIPHIDYLREAYLESEKLFADYIYGNIPVTGVPVFNLRFIKYKLKLLLGK